MPKTCNGCGQLFKATGLKNHIRQSTNPRCREIDSHSPPTLPQGRITSNPSPDDNIAIPTDPVGDFFGNYATTALHEHDWESPNDVPAEVLFNHVSHLAQNDAEELTPESHDDDNSDQDSDSDSIIDEDDFLAESAEQEIGLEVPRQFRHVTQAPAAAEDRNDPKAKSSPMRLRGGAGEQSLAKKPVVVSYPTSSDAGKVHSTEGVTANGRYAGEIKSGDTEGIYAPFSSKLEWEIARWAKLRGPSSTALNELLRIKGVPEKLGLSFKTAKELNKMIDHLLPGRPRFQRHEVMVAGEVCEVYYRDVLACIRALLGDPDFASKLVYVPEKHYTDEKKKVRMYHDMQTGKWWWSTQEALDRDNPGGTIVPLIISTDKTQLTLFRNKSAYPVYMTIGNIPKEIRRKPSSRAYVLLGYLPTTQLENVTNKSARRRQLANLYHACMSRIFAPLQRAGEAGFHSFTAEGIGRRFHPIVACVVSDYPEHVLTTCTSHGECPTCDCPRKDIGNPNTNHKLRELEEVIRVLDSFESDPGGFLQACKNIGIKPVVDPFWKDLPYVHIYRSITPDILHQLYQGIMKHLIKWLIEACGAAEIDARCRRMPPNHNIRIFMKGISSLSRVSGHEHDQMCRLLLGLVLDAPLTGSLSNIRLLRAVRALLDFLYLAQYPIHTDETLELLDDALETFHDNKSIFIDLGIRSSFQIPKLHWASHYIQAIRYYGTTDNYNTQYTERLHIDLAKDAYAATNHKDEFTQMTIWVERKEKILRHAQFIAWKQLGSPATQPQEWSPPGLELDRSLRLTKHPSKRSVHFNDIMDPNKYGARFFRTALMRWIIVFNNPTLSAAQVERRLWTTHVPFQRLPIWHRMKFVRNDPATGKTSTADSIHVRPARQDSKGREVPGRFDTAYVNEGAGLVTGIQGYRVGRIRVVFSIPPRYHSTLFKAGSVIPQNLAYVEWYSAFQEPDPEHGLYKVSPLKDREGGRICSIIPVANIRRSVHLFPRFGPQAPQEWTSSTVLDLCDTFYVNEFSDRHFYRIISD